MHTKTYSKKSYRPVNICKNAYSRVYEKNQRTNNEPKIANLCTTIFSLFSFSQSLQEKEVETKVQKTIFWDS